MILPLLAGSISGCTTISNTYTDITGYFFAKDSGFRKKVVITRFDSGLAGMKPRANDLGMKLKNALVKSGGVIVADEARFRKLFNSLTDRVPNPIDRLLASGRRMGLNSIVLGQIASMAVERKLTGIWGFRQNDPFLVVEIQLTVYDVPSGTVAGIKVLSSRMAINEILAYSLDQGQGKPPDKIINKLVGNLINPSVRWVARQVAAQYWAAFVMERQGDKVIVSAGSQSGLSEGMLLNIYAQGSPIRAASGRTYYLPGGAVGQVRLTKLEKDRATGQIVGKNPKPVQRGMLVRPR